MTRQQPKTWQFKVSSGLTILMLFLVLSYFFESFLEIRKVKPVTVAIERIAEPPAGQSENE